MSHLTDTQLVILSNAAQAEDGFVLPLPDCLTINGGAIASVLSSLLRKGLVEERPLQGKGIASAGPHATGASSYGANRTQERVWRCDDDGRRVVLVITPAGLDAIGIDADGDDVAGTGETGIAPTACSLANANEREPVHDTSATPDAAVCTNAGGEDAEAGTRDACTSPGLGPDHSDNVPPGLDTARNPVRPGTRQALLVDMLRRDGGASLKVLVQATGWQQHSVRGAISSTVRKKLGLTVVSETVEGRGRVYRIIP